jgi:hypothetical protein
MHAMELLRVCRRLLGPRASHPGRARKDVIETIGFILRELHYTHRYLTPEEQKLFRISKPEREPTKRCKLVRIDSDKQLLEISDPDGDWRFEYEELSCYPIDVRRPGHPWRDKVPYEEPPKRVLNLAMRTVRKEVDNG